MLEHFLQNPKAVNIFKIYFEHRPKTAIKGIYWCWRFLLHLFWYLWTELWVRHKPVVPMMWRALNMFIYLQSHTFHKPPSIIKSLKIRFNMIILKYMLQVLSSSWSIMSYVRVLVTEGPNLLIYVHSWKQS